ncbi:PA1571 family protein [Acinetobacter sp. MD2]|uniref:PA1571 family protein n=1 Tax=Acinetobacter sp. MD2 TaxID=2600066 RepID=UPI002D1ECE10|nr:PA1571 family protein [Acinetobacter sp. MD2]MEB3767563.1 hypothetical protein [Acinetobacter sp. MD2]
MQICEENSINRKVQQTAEQHVAQNDCYMLDEHGKEVPITTTMVQDVCIELLKLCRTVKN